MEYGRLAVAQTKYRYAKAETAVCSGRVEDAERGLEEAKAAFSAACDYEYAAFCELERLQAEADGDPL